MNVVIRRRLDRILAFAFGVFTVIFILLMTRESFFEWAFDRHRNQLSWYVRPILLIPFCYSAYRKSLAGVMISLFALLTSMFWFPAPESVNERVDEFLRFERRYLTDSWDSAKIALTAMVPLSLSLLALSFWKRNVWLGAAVLVLMAVGKTTWSIHSAGDAGMSILIPAVIGLVLCAPLVMLSRRSSRD